MSIALKSDGSLWSLGANGGANVYVANVNAPMQVGSDLNWKMISQGESYFLAIKTDGSIRTWGSNFAGQLGTGDYKDSYVPVRIKF